MEQQAWLQVESLTVWRRFVLSRPLVASAITGVTTIQQLDDLIAAASKGPLDQDLLDAIDSVHLKYPNPTP